MVFVRALSLLPLALVVAGCAVSTQSAAPTTAQALEGRWRHLEEDGVARIESVLSYDAAHRRESSMTVRYHEDGPYHPGCVTTRTDTGPTWSTDGSTLAAAGTSTWTLETTGCKDRAFNEPRTVRSGPVDGETRPHFTIDGDELTLRYDFDGVPVLLRFERL
jgi:hypothetical protein